MTGTFRATSIFMQIQQKANSGGTMCQEVTLAYERAEGQGYTLRIAKIWCRLDPHEERRSKSEKVGWNNKRYIV